MDSQIRELMAQIEAWESAVEFGIPEDLWEEYQVRIKSDDLYIASMAAIFDTLRIEDQQTKTEAFSSLAKTLLIYSKSAASKYLDGVEKNLNLLYVSALFYLADYPATASLIAKDIHDISSANDVELFLLGFLSRRLSSDDGLQTKFQEIIDSDEQSDFGKVTENLLQSEKRGLFEDPRLFIASKLARSCIERFTNFNTWNVLQQHTSNFSPTVWRPFLINTEVFPLWELFPSQLSAVQSGILGDTNAVYSLQMPTSSGKTSFCELLIYHEVKVRRKRVLFLVPFRALAAEIKDGISKRLEKAGVGIVASYGGNIPTRSETASVETADVLIVTPEKFIALSQSISNFQDSFETIICDEGHLIDDDSRGLQYELLLTKLKGEEIGKRKIVFISAILPNVDSIHSWLGGKSEGLAVSEYHPVETDYAFITSDGNDCWKLDFNTIYKKPRKYSLKKFLTKDDFRYLNPITNNRNLISGYRSPTSVACAAALKARNNGQVALFTTMKGNNGVKGLTEKLIFMLEHSVGATKLDPPAPIHLPSLVEYIGFQFGVDYSLSKAVSFGIGFHHGSLPQEIRREMEVAIQNGAINILVCTSTLAEGVNLPIRTLVIHTIKRYNGTLLTEIQKRSIKNIVGRVGRAGKETRGRIIFANNKERDYVENVFRDISLEPAKGALFNLVSALNKAVEDGNLTLNNELFEQQAPAFLIILDKIDNAIIDLMPVEVLIDEIEVHVARVIERTLAYQYFETDILRSRLKEIFLIRAEALYGSFTSAEIITLRQSGSSPRFLKFANDSSILNQVEWTEMVETDDSNWLTQVVLKLFEMPTFAGDIDLQEIKTTIVGWMSGNTYAEIADESGLIIEDSLDLLCRTIGYTLQDALGKVTQLAIAKHGEDAISELTTNWASLLQYGLGSLQQLDLFERGASDRLGVWGISRYLEANDISLRGTQLLARLKDNSIELIEFLRTDPRVPKLSLNRTIEELKLTVE